MDLQFLKMPWQVFYTEVTFFFMPLISSTSCTFTTSFTVIFHIFRKMVSIGMKFLLGVF